MSGKEVSKTEKNIESFDTPKNDYSPERPAPKRMGGPGGHGGPRFAGEKAGDFSGTTKKLLKYVSPYAPHFIMVIIFAVAATVFSVMSPKILGGITDEIYKGVIGKITGSGVGINFDAIGNIALKLIIIYVTSAVLSYIQGFILTGAANKIIFKLREDISIKINKLPLSYFDKTSQGEILSRVSNDIDTLAQTINQSFTQIITSATALVGIMIMMFSINWIMTLVALCVIPISMVFVVNLVKRSQKYFKTQQQYLGNLNGHIEEMYGGHIVMKAFNGEKDSVERFEKHNTNLHNSARKAQFLSGLIMPVMFVLSNISYVVICILGSWLASKGTIGIGNIQSFFIYMRQFTQPINQLANTSNIMQSTIAAAERVFDFLEQKEEIEDKPIVFVNNDPNTPDNDTLVTVRGSILFAHVNFGYLPEKTIINDFSAMVEPGQMVAIVGPTGAGKTTMVKLLMRFYDVNSGAILLDGYNIKDFSRNDLRSQFGMVLQDAWQYSDTIMENIRYGRLTATDAEVKQAAKAAQVDRLVRTLPDGYKTMLNEETTNISQGQKQLITIARAILADPKVLILDEATSSVDTRTEILIQKAMKNLMKGRTSFVIAHRLSTIRDADMILCMRDGDIVEKGTHDELMTLGGFYAQLYNSQFDTVTPA